MAWVAENSSDVLDDRSSVLFQNATPTTSGSKYFSHLFISERKYKNINLY
jgi:hypothetical protein